MDNFAAANGYDQITLIIDAQALRPAKAKPDGFGTRARCDHEVIFELPLIGPVVDQVDSWIDVAVSDLAVGRDIGAPLVWVVADQIVGSPFKRGYSFAPRLAIGA